MKKQLIRAAAATVLGLSLTAGFASADTITANGRGSSNTDKTTTSNSSTVRNTNGLGVFNLNGQRASSGQASAHDSVNAGSATTGSASNGSSSATTVGVNNSASSTAAAMGGWASAPSSNTISDNLAKSTNQITSSTTNTMTVTNNNTETVTNVNLQSAHSGKATVKDTVNGGNASTGAASNTSNTQTTVNVSN